MSSPTPETPRIHSNSEAQRAWNTNARFWDQRMGEGNDFFNILTWPAVERLLNARPRDRILDVACGNGLTSRRLAQVGARVLAFDFSEEMIAAARERTHGLDIDYRVLDATDPVALAALGAGTFDAALCNMGLMDLADLTPLMTALATLLRPGGRFVFSVMHPCFNNPTAVQVAEQEDRQGEIVATYSVKVSRYLTPYARLGLAMRDQPVPHPYFHRPLQVLLGAGFAAGLVVDALEERAFPPESSTGNSPLSWSRHFSEIPPALVVRMRGTGVECVA